MTEYKVGDKIMYRGIEGVVVDHIGELYEVRLEKDGRYLRADEMEPLKTAKGCVYCKHGEPLNDTSNSNFALVVRCDDANCYLETEYDPGDWSESEYPIINYCPMCGRKLEQEEE